MPEPPKYRYLTRQEFMDFLKGKIMYHHQCSWIERWPVNIEYIPKVFILADEDELVEYGYPGYGKECRGIRNEKGVYYGELHRWVASYNSRNKRYMVREIAATIKPEGGGDAA